MCLPHLHWDLRGNKGHWGATFPCKRELSTQTGVCYEQCCPLVLTLEGAHHRARPAEIVFSQGCLLRRMVSSDKVLLVRLPSLCMVVFALAALLF